MPIPAHTLPAKVIFDPIMPQVPNLSGLDGNPNRLSLGPPWKASGARRVVYLKPGLNKIPLVGGDFKCTFSRGPEYDILTKEVHLAFEEPQTVKAALKHLVPTPGMTSMDLNEPTDARPAIARLRRGSRPCGSRRGGRMDCLGRPE